MKQLHPFRVMLVVAFLFIVGLAFWLSGARPSKSQFPAKLRLANGSTVEILNFAYSAEMPMQTLNVWERVLDNLPYRMQPGGLRMPISLPLPAKSLFIVYRPEKRLPPSVPDDVIKLSIVDDNGFEIIEEGGSYQLNTSPTIICGHTFKNFPKRSRNIKLRFYVLNRLQGEISYPNPYRLEPSVIPAQKRTDKQTIGDLTVELQSVIWDLPAKDVPFSMEEEPKPIAGNIPPGLKKPGRFSPMEAEMKLIFLSKGEV